MKGVKFRIDTSSESLAYGLLLIRVVFGLSRDGHGVEKLFGWFGGPGSRVLRLGSVACGTARGG